MNSPSLLDKTYHVIIKRLVETGQAPHYTEIATELGLSVEEARGVLQNLMSKGIPGIWLFPDTDYISSFAPLQQSADPIPDHRGGGAKMVWSVRF